MLKDVLKKFKAMSFIYILNGILQILAASLSVVYFQKLIDELPATKAYTDVLPLIIIYAFLLLLDCILSYLDEYPLRILSNGIYQEIKIQALKKIGRIDYSAYQDLGTGSLIQLVENGADAGKSILFDFYLTVFKDLLPQIVISLILIGSYNFKIMLIILIGYVIVFAISNKLMKKLYEIKDNVLASEELLSKHFVRGFMELVVFRLNKCFAKEIAKVEKTSNQIVKDKAKIRMVHELFFTLFALIIILIKLAVLFIGTMQIIKGETTIGTIIALIAFVDKIYSPIAIFNVIFIDFKLNKVTFKRFKEFMILADDKNLLEGKTPHISKGDITFNNVSFKYGDNLILNDLSLTIKGGTSTAIVGASGGGKSTMIKMILGLLKPSSGEILIDADNLSHLLLNDYYDLVSYVSQDAPIFDGTLRENIVFDARVTDDEIYSILEEVKLKDFVMNLPLKLDTEVGEKGVKISGGEKQRLALARLFFQKSQIVILDEPTSALDSLTEETVTTNMLKRLKGKTIIVIAHRLHTIKDVDKILVIDKGTVEDCGLFDELIAKQGLFYELWSCQNAS